MVVLLFVSFVGLLLFIVFLSCMSISLNLGLKGMDISLKKVSIM